MPSAGGQDCTCISYSNYIKLVHLRPCLFFFGSHGSLLCRCPSVCAWTSICVLRVRSRWGGRRHWRVALLTWLLPLKFGECCCIQLLLAVRGFVAMATQPCAPAQGRSSSSELSGVLHIWIRRGRENERKYFKVTNQKHIGDGVVLKQTQPFLRLPLWYAHRHGHINFCYFLQHRNKTIEKGNGREIPGLEVYRFFCQLIKYLAGQWEKRYLVAAEARNRAWLCVFLSLMVHCCEATWGFFHLLSPPLLSSVLIGLQETHRGSAACLLAPRRPAAAQIVR